MNIVINSIILMGFVSKITFIHYRHVGRAVFLKSNFDGSYLLNHLMEFHETWWQYGTVIVVYVCKILYTWLPLFWSYRKSNLVRLIMAHRVVGWAVAIRDVFQFLTAALYPNSKLILLSTSIDHARHWHLNKKWCMQACLHEFWTMITRLSIKCESSDRDSRKTDVVL